MQMKNIGIIGLGYVGLPLAVEFGKLTRVIGYDINPSRVRELEAGIDRTQECSAKELEMAKHLTFTNNQNDLKGCDFYIITVPTPIDENKNPDLSAIRSASETVSSVMSAGAYIIYGPTVYPGVTVDFVCQFWKSLVVLNSTKILLATVQNALTLEIRIKDLKIL